MRTPVNPRIVEMQISGAAMMQLGFTMFEKINLDNGQITNASLADYKYSRHRRSAAADVQRGDDAYQSNAPFGAGRRRSPPTMPLSPAIANAI